MDELYAKIGRQTLLAEKQDAEYTAVLNLLAQVISGETDRSRVFVNLTDRQWAVMPPGKRPPMPATINGVPVCVVGVEDAQCATCFPEGNPPGGNR